MHIWCSPCYPKADATPRLVRSLFSGGRLRNITEVLRSALQHEKILEKSAKLLLNIKSRTSPKRSSASTTANTQTTTSKAQHTPCPSLRPHTWTQAASRNPQPASQEADSCQSHDPGSSRPRLCSTTSKATHAQVRCCGGSFR